MAEFEDNLLSPEELERAIAFRRRIPIEERSPFLRETGTPMIRMASVVETLKQFDLPFKKPSKEKETEGSFVERKAVISRNLLGYNHVVDGEAQSTLAEVILPSIGKYNQKSENIRENFLTTGAFIISVFQHEFGSEFMDKLTQFSAQDIQYAYEEAMKLSSGELMTYSIRLNEVFQTELPKRIPLYQVHLQDGIDRIKDQYVTGNVIGLQDGAAAMYNVARLVFERPEDVFTRIESELPKYNQIALFSLQEPVNDKNQVETSEGNPLPLHSENNENQV